MADYLMQTGLYWRPLGGNNIDQISGHCYQYTDIILQNGQPARTTIIVDLGKFDNHQALGIKNSAAAVPDIRELLNSRELNPRALFLTHSHPDHLNGIVHYLKAGYKLPPLYGGRYTKMILDQLYEEFDIAAKIRPAFIEINDGSLIKAGSLEIEAVASSHTCFDSFGLMIKSANATVYHIRELAPQINAVVADFYGITEDGFAPKEVATFKKLVQLMRRARKPKVFIPVYPTHPEMYIIAFLAALKLRKNVVFYGSRDFYGYLELINAYGISFEKLAGKRIKVLFKPNEELAGLGDNYVVIGTFNDLGRLFNESPADSFGIITAKTFFNPLKGQLNARNIPFVSVDKVPELQGFGHGFWGDYEYLGQLLPQAEFIPTHCPVFVTEYVRDLALGCGMKLIKTVPHNNEVFRLSPPGAERIYAAPAAWLVVNYDGDYAYFTEVWQKPTSGEGLLRRTISSRRCRNKFKMFLHTRKTKGSSHGIKEIR